MGRTAKEAGWHRSRYNIMAPLPGTDRTVVVNLIRGSCEVYSLPEMYLLSVAEELDENHPILDYFAKRGLIANFDELAVIEAYGRGACAFPKLVSLTLCPTMGCNFDCPYCFENHRAGRMSRQVQDGVAALAGRLLEVSGVKNLHVTWFGGEPLLMPDIIEALSERLMNLCRERNVKYSARIVTNGYLLTRETVSMLDRVKVNQAQITLDGMGDAHNATRHLSGGGPTFDRIAENLRTLKIPFRVLIRHNVHMENVDELDLVKAFILSLAQESGNEIDCYPAIVNNNSAARQRRDTTRRVCGTESVNLGIERDCGKPNGVRGHFCGANSLWFLGVDDRGNLYKCWEAVDKPERSFGTVSAWDPGDPFRTASRPDMLTAYLNTAMPTRDAECADCVWLPVCSGGCPNQRLFEGGRLCLPYRDHPEDYALAVYRRRENQRNAQRQ